MITDVVKEKECEEKQFMPVHRKEDLLNKKEQAEHQNRQVGFAMWMSAWWQTFIPFLLAPDAEKLANTNMAPITKLRNGDFIKVKDLLEYTSTDLDHIDHNGRSDRKDGKVIVIDIHYTNWKEDSWPNKVDPAYFYSFSVAPTDEFKLMQQSSRAHLARRDPDGRREIYDYHGLFIILKQGGSLGVISFQRLFLLFIGLIFIEGLYRSIFLCVVLNFDLDGGKMFGRNRQGAEFDVEAEVDHAVTKDFHLHGRRASVAQE